MLVTSNTPPGVDPFKETLRGAMHQDIQFCRIFFYRSYKFSGTSLSFYNSMNIYRSAGKVGQN